MHIFVGTTATVAENQYGDQSAGHVLHKYCRLHAAKLGHSKYLETSIRYMMIFFAIALDTSIAKCEISYHIQ